MAMIKRLDLWLLTVLSAALVVASWRGWLPYSLIETFGFVTGAASVYLTLKLDILNFPVGIANDIFFLVLFAQARLFAGAGLQLVYLILAIHGWYWWLYGGPQRTALDVGRATRKQWAALILFVLLGTIGLTLTLRAVNGSAPVLDALTTVLSLAAQYLLNYKLIENWFVWITADVIFIYLYRTSELRLTAILYVIFLCLCIGGLINWRRVLRAREAAASAAPGGNVLREEAAHD